MPLEDVTNVHFVAAKRKRQNEKLKKTFRNFRFQSRLAQRKCVRNLRGEEGTKGTTIQLRLLLSIGGGKGVN